MKKILDQKLSLYINMIESKVVILNMCLYIGLFFYCILRYKWKNLSTVLSLLYAISSVAAYMLYNFPIYDWTFTSNGKSTLEACLYSFTLNYLLIMAFAKCNLDSCKLITNYNNYFILSIEKILVVFLTIYTLYALPVSIMHFFSGEDLSELRNSAYNLSTRIKYPFVIELIDRIFGAMPIVLICMISIRYFMLKRFSVWDKMGLYIYILIKLSTILGVISRATIIFSLMEMFVIFCLFYNYFSLKIKKKIIKYAIIIGPILFVTFTSISASRFSKGEDLQSELATLRYMGEAQLNFMNLAYPDLKKPFMGYSQFSLFRRVLGLSYNDGSNRQSESVINPYIQKTYGYKHPSFIFYGASGNIYMNWGKFAAVIICLLIYWLVRHSYKRSNKISFMQIVVTIVLAAYVGKGIFYSDYSGEAGNLMIFFIIIMSIYLRDSGRTIPIYGSLGTHIK